MPTVEAAVKQSWETIRPFLLLRDCEIGSRYFLGFCWVVKNMWFGKAGLYISLMNCYILQRTAGLSIEKHVERNNNENGVVSC